MKIELDYQICLAVAQDAANSNMRRQGRTSWSADDYDIAYQVFKNLWGKR